MDTSEKKLNDDFQHLSMRKQELTDSINQSLSDLEKQLFENVQNLMADLQVYVQDIVADNFHLQQIERDLDSIQRLRNQILRMQDVLCGFTDLSKSIIDRGMDEMPTNPCQDIMDANAGAVGDGPDGIPFMPGL